MSVKGEVLEHSSTMLDLAVQWERLDALNGFPGDFNVFGTGSFHLTLTLSGGL